MGVLFDEELGLEVGSEYYKIRPVERLLGIGDVEHEARIVNYYADMPSFFADGRRIFSIDQILFRDGGLILGEGDSGKSVYVNMLRDAAAVVGPVKLIHLRSDLQDGSTIQDCVKKVVAQVHNQIERATLIFDGLDENEKYGKELKTVLADSRIFQECRIWVASRPCAAAAALSGSVVAGMVYKLLPISHQDIHKIVEQVDAVSEEEFLKIVKEAHLESFLRKPGGVIVLLKLFANGNLKVTGRDAAMLNIAEDYARAMRDGQIEDLGDEGFSDRDLVDCAGWIATCLFFSGKDSIWRGRASDSPAMALRQEDLPLGFYNEGIIKEVLLRRLFEPLESVRLRITYADMANYLAGWWVGRHFPVCEINRLIKDVQVISPDLGAVVMWASHVRPEAALSLIGRRSECFFSSHDSIRLYGVGAYFDALSERFNEDMPIHNDSLWYEHGDELSGMSELADEAKTRILDPRTSEYALILAAWLLRNCKVDREASVDVVVDVMVTRRPSEKVLSYLCDELVHMCGPNRYASLERLKCFLNESPKNYHGENLLGGVLRLLWPNWLTAEEFTLQLIEPSGNIHTLYRELFSQYMQDNSVVAALNNISIVPFLVWAKHYCIKKPTSQYLYGIARFLFQLAWKWAENDSVAVALTDIILEHYKHGNGCDFLYEEEDPGVKRIYPPDYVPFTVKQYPLGRLKVLKLIVECEEVPKEKIAGYANRGTAYCLCDEEDFDWVYSLWEKAHECGHVEMAEKWIALLAAIVRTSEDAERRNKITYLHQLYPQVQNFDVEFLEQSFGNDQCVGSESQGESSIKESENGPIMKDAGLCEKDVLTNLTPDLLRTWGDRTVDSFAAKVLSTQDAMRYIEVLAEIQERTGRQFASLRGYLRRCIRSNESLMALDNHLINVIISENARWFFPMLVKGCGQDPKRIRKWFEWSVDADYRYVERLIVEAPIDSVVEFYVWACAEYLPRLQKGVSEPERHLIETIGILLWNEFLHRLVLDVNEYVVRRIEEAYRKYRVQHFKNVLEEVKLSHDEKYKRVIVPLTKLDQLCKRSATDTR